MDINQILETIRKMAEEGNIPPKKLEDLISDHEPIVSVGKLSDFDAGYACRPFKELLHPEFVNSGPSSFDASKVKKWLHPLQRELLKKPTFLEILRPEKRKQLPSGHAIYAYLEKHELLEDCMGLNELIAIRARGDIFFKRYFGNCVLCGWKAVVRNPCRGNKEVPVIHAHESVVSLDWYDLMWQFDGSSWQTPMLPKSL